jgi:hypothetical protein
VKILTGPTWAIDDGKSASKAPPPGHEVLHQAVRGKGTVVELDARDAAGWITERLKEKFVL